MTTLNKILIGLLALVVVVAFAFIVVLEKQSKDQINQLSQAITQQKELLDNITRSQSSYATKDDIASFAKQANVNLDAIQKDLNKLNAQITGINQVSVNSAPQTLSNLPSTKTTPTTNTNPPTVVCNGTALPCPDPYGYLSNTQTLELNEQFQDVKVPIGTVSFSASKDKPWDASINERKYNITNVLGTDKNNKHYVYNKVSIESGGKSYDVKIDNAKFEEELPSSSFSWFNPKLHMNVAGGVQLGGVSSQAVSGDASVGASLAIMSYGQTTVTPTLSILQVGAGYQINSKRPYIGINPISLNIGKTINTEVINNTYIGPTFQVNTKGSIMSGLGVSISF